MSVIAPTTSGTPTSPLARYQAELASGLLTPDPGQRAVVEHMERLHARLLATSAAASAARGLGRWLRRSVPVAVPPRGVYLWGSVGRGKTHMVDCFYDCLPPGEKRRVHFHSFMQSVHRALRRLKDIERPLDRVAGEFATQARVLCLDEFHVSDITDAMILANLLRALFAQGVILVTTSNEPPERLYWNGLQRTRFLPAIELLGRTLDVLHIDGPVDYRLRALERAPIYHVPPGPEADAALAEAFERIAGAAGEAGRPFAVDGREIPTRRQCAGVVWFDFEPLCAGPRGVGEYIEIARCFHTVLISGLPLLGAQDDDAAKRFMLLVDEFYDRGVKLVLSAAASPTGLYQGSRLGAAFQRTASRLMEMQTHDYLAQPHLSE